MITKIDEEATKYDAKAICGASFQVEANDYVLLDEVTRTCYLYFYGTMYGEKGRKLNFNNTINRGRK